MVAIPRLDLIIAVTWVTVLTLVVVGRALTSWLRFRRTSNYAIYARLLSEATQPRPEVTGPATPAGAQDGQAEVIPFPARSSDSERSASQG
jgi:hypothetical protein